MATILLLTSFLVLQYARQVSYLECRLSNYFKTENQKCDCEKLINQETGKSEPSPAPVHNHLHLDESFYPSRTITEGVISDTEIPARYLAHHIFIGKTIPARLDRPPQTS